MQVSDHLLAWELDLVTCMQFQTLESNINSMLKNNTNTRNECKHTIRWSWCWIICWGRSWIYSNEKIAIEKCANNNKYTFVSSIPSVGAGVGSILFTFWLVHISQKQKHKQIHKQKKIHAICWSWSRIICWCRCWIVRWGRRWIYWLCAVRTKKKPTHQNQVDIFRNHTICWRRCRIICWCWCWIICGCCCGIYLLSNA